MTCLITDAKGNQNIRFQRRLSESGASALEVGVTFHEGQFGCQLRAFQPRQFVSVDSVEHAKSIIHALEYAVDNGWLFTESEIDKLNTSATDTRGTLLRKKHNK